MKTILLDIERLNAIEYLLENSVLVSDHEGEVLDTWEIAYPDSMSVKVRWISEGKSGSYFDICLVDDNIDVEIMPPQYTLQNVFRFADSDKYDFKFVGR